MDFLTDLLWVIVDFFEWKNPKNRWVRITSAILFAAFVIGGSIWFIRSYSYLL
jgi:hypothetical protein